MPAELKAVDPADAALPVEDSPAHNRTVRMAQTIVIACVLAAPVFICLHSFDMSDSDVWWHLRSGEWIAIHHAVPQFEPFSRSAAGTPWVAYSWAFELLIFRMFQALGYLALPLYSAVMVLLISVAVYWTVQRERLELPVAALVTFACMYSMGHLFTPRPWQFTILLFVSELAILMHARRTGITRHLVWIPLIFAIWANVHIQFVDGLFVLGLAVVEAVTSRWSAGAQKNLGVIPLLATLVASVVATLANPYGWRIYAVAHDLATQSGALDKISELQAIPFRDPAAYLVLLLAIGSAAVLGWERRVLSFEAALLAFAALLSFRSQRDVWVIAIVAAAILAPALPKARKATEVPTAGVVAAAFALAILFSSISFRLLTINNSTLESRLEQHMPVRAVSYIRQHGYPGPVFNDFNWGGFLTWNLRIPVTIDGRQNVYGDQRMDRSVATWGGAPDWASDPDLTSARLIIGPVRTPLVQLLRRDAHYQLVYEDQLAAVFTRRDQPR